MGGFLVRKQNQELTWRTSAIELEMPSGHLCSRWNPSTSPPATILYQRCHWIVSSPDRSRLWREGQGRFHFLFFYVCSANQDQFYYISFIRGNHLGPHYNKHIGFFPLLQPLLAVLLRIISQSDKSTTCQQTCSVCVLCPRPAQVLWWLELNAPCPRRSIYQRAFCRKS